MGLAVLIILGIIEGAALAAGLFVLLKKQGSAAASALPGLLKVQTERKDLAAKFDTLFGGMVDVGSLRIRMKELRGFQESLKAERGRITITQAELETVENRLRELEEIERELEASGLETKEELTILRRKAQELVQQNEQLKSQIASSSEQMEKVLKDLELSSEMQGQIDAMKAELLECEQKTTELMTLIEQGNEQYLIMKRRYDALDIEYAPAV
ncbi:MAG: hypothetical protein QY326_04445 [Bdellovibrionota bacterium]|nr:MAG: hypothetical protein QY326_04445 [Bdellovibrionota bacterium]